MRAPHAKTGACGGCKSTRFARLTALLRTCKNEPFAQRRGPRRTVRASNRLVAEDTPPLCAVMIACYGNYNPDAPIKLRSKNQPVVRRRQLAGALVIPERDSVYMCAAWNRLAAPNLGLALQPEGTDPLDVRVAGGVGTVPSGIPWDEAL